ncbi:hypothetical protein BsWGS_25805 [Bradybaena similaris]
MEMQNNVCFLPFNSDEVGADCSEFINVEELLIGNDYPSFLVGSDVSLTNFNLLEPDDMFSCVKTELLPTKDGNSGDSLKSPWHESDSGVSETLSFVGSPADPCSASQIVGEDFCQAETVTYKSSHSLSSVSETQTSDDLMAYLLGETDSAPDTASMVVSKDENATPVSSSRRPSRTISRKKWDAEFTFFDSDDSDEQSHERSRTKLPRSAKPLSNKNEVSMTPSRGNVINIVKLVKPHCSEPTDDDIIQALDNRSKKNAQQAKLNREKKKAYIKSLENDRDHLMKENTELSSQVEDINKKMLNLEAEVDYLKSVLANSSALAGLLKNISNVKEVKLTSSFSSRKRGYENDHSYNLTDGRPGKKVKEESKAGVCLHVNDGTASLEFCGHCSSLSRKTHSYSKIS